MINPSTSEIFSQKKSAKSEKKKHIRKSFRKLVNLALRLFLFPITGLPNLIFNSSTDNKNPSFEFGDFIMSVLSLISYFKLISIASFLKTNFCIKPQLISLLFLLSEISNLIMFLFRQRGRVILIKLNRCRAHRD